MFQAIMFITSMVYFTSVVVRLENLFERVKLLAEVLLPASDSPSPDTQP